MTESCIYEMMDMYVSVKCIFNKCPINIIVPYINCGWQRENNEIHFTNDILAHSWNKILKHFFPLIYIVMSQWGFHTCHDSYAVVTCAKLWLDWVIILSHKSTTYLQKIQIMNSKTLFVKLEELHIVTARKPLIHQNQPVAQYLHKIQPCML